MNTPAEPWMYCECEGGCTLHGNREAYQLLKTKIDQLLGSGERNVAIAEKNVELGCLELREPREVPDLPMTFLQKVLTALLAFIVLSIPVSILLLAVFGLIQLIHILS